jgi:hypothetical protein
MPKDYARGAAVGLVLAVFITIMTCLTLLVGSLLSTTAACFAPHVMEQKPEGETSRPSLNLTEPGIDI